MPTPSALRLRMVTPSVARALHAAVSTAPPVTGDRLESVTSALARMRASHQTSAREVSRV